MSNRRTEREEIRSLLGEANAEAKATTKDREAAQDDGNNIRAKTIVNYGTIIVGPSTGHKFNDAEKPEPEPFEDSLNASPSDKPGSQFNRRGQSFHDEIANQDSAFQRDDTGSAELDFDDGYDPFTAGPWKQYKRCRSLGQPAHKALLGIPRKVADDAAGSLCDGLLWIIESRRTFTDVAPKTMPIALAFAMLLYLPAVPLLALDAEDFISHEQGKSHQVTPFSNPVSPHTQQARSLVP